MTNRPMAVRDPATERAVQRWLATFVSDNTRHAYRRDLHVFRSWLAAQSLDMGEVVGRDVEAFRAACEADGSGASTVNRRVAAIASYYRFVGGFPTALNPTEGVTRRPVDSTAPVALSVAQADRVWHSSLALGPRTSVIVALVMLNGWKAHELLALDATSVEFDRRSVRIDGGPVLDTRTAAALRTHIGARRDGPLLYGENPTREPARLTRFGVDYLVKRIGVHAGIDGSLTVNVLRATHESLDAGIRPARNANRL